MSLLDNLEDFFNPVANLAYKKQQLEYNNLLSQQSAQSKLGLGVDPTTGITWNAPTAPTGNYTDVDTGQSAPIASASPDVQNLLRPGMQQQAQDLNLLKRQAFPDAAISQAQEQAFPSPHKIGFAPPGSQPTDEKTGQPVGPRVPDKAPEDPEVLRALTALQAMSPTDPRRGPLQAWVQNKTHEGQPERISYTPMTSAQLQQWGLPPGTVASMGSNGKPDIINKATPGSFLTEQGISPDATPDEIRAKLSGTAEGADLIRQAQAVLDGKEELQKISSRSGETQGNRLRSVVYALEPGFSPEVGKRRIQLNQELYNMSDRAMGGKLASADKIINHATELLDSAADMKNDSALGNFGNSIENSIVGARTGSPMKTNLREYTDIRSKLGSESAKFMGGGVASDAAKAEVDHSYNQNDDLTGTIGAVGGTVKMMEGQVQPMVDKYNQAYGTNLEITDPKFMSPATAAKLSTLKDILVQAKAGRPVTPQSVKAALLAARSAAPGQQAAIEKPSPQAIVDELRRRGHVQ